MKAHTATAPAARAPHARPNVDHRAWCGDHVDLDGTVTSVYHTGSFNSFTIIATARDGKHLATLTDMSGDDARAFAMHGYLNIV